MARTNGSSLGVFCGAQSLPLDQMILLQSSRWSDIRLLRFRENERATVFYAQQSGSDRLLPPRFTANE